MGIPDDYMSYAVGRESGGDPNAQNPLSSASGLYQFTNGTRADVARRHGIDPRDDTALMQAFTADNAKVLSDAGHPTNTQNLYLAHRFGPQGALKALSSDPTASVSDVFPEVMRQNPDLRGKTIADLTGTRAAPQSAAPMGQGALTKMADPQAPDQSFLGALGSKLMAGGPGALFGAPNGVFPGAQGPGTGYDLGHALQNAGAWAQAPGSPGGAAALLSGTQKEGPQFGPIGEDMFGQKTYGWINKANRSISPAVMSGDANNAPGYSAAGVGAANTGGMSGLLSSLETAKANGASQADLLKLVPPQMSSEVGSILNYQGIPASLSRNGTLKSAVTMVAHTIDPSYDERTYPAQMQYMKGLNSPTLSSPGGQKLALGTGLEHLQTLSDNAVGMNNSNGPMGDMPGGDLVARAINSGKNSSVDQSAKGTAMESAAQKYSGEVMKLYSGASGGGVAERDAVAGRYSKNMTPTSLAASLETDLALMKGKLTNLEQQRDAAGISPERAQFLAAPQKAAIAKIEANIARLRQPQGQALPQGVTSIKVLGQ